LFHQRPVETIREFAGFLAQPPALLCQAGFPGKNTSGCLLFRRFDEGEVNGTAEADGLSAVGGWNVVAIRTFKRFMSRHTIDQEDLGGLPQQT